MSTAIAVRSYGRAALAVSSAPPIVADRPVAGLSVMEPHASLITSDVQLTLALTTGWHDGPLFIVQKRRAPVIHGGTLGGKRRRRREWRATPNWLSPEQRAAIRLLYAQAARLTRETGEMHVVDHIVPLDGKLVCGLHVPWNMRVIHWRANAVKSWHTWPDMPFEQLEIF